MTNIPQNYNKMLKNIIFNIYSTNLNNKLDLLDNTNKVLNYVDILSSLDQSLCDIAKETLITFFETIDRSFRNSTERRKKYDIKSYQSRTILTIFGEITFKRTFYTSKVNFNYYCHLDRFLGLHKYDYFDPYLKALVVEHVSDNNYSKTASILNDLIGNRVSLDKKVKYFTKQNIRSIFMNSILSRPEITKKETPKTLYIMADEKFIPTQNNDNKDVMVKSIVLFEDRQLVGKKRVRLTNKMIFSSSDNSHLEDCINYIDNTYETDKIKTIYVMGDGASWIKSLVKSFKFHKDLNIFYILDKFHCLQSIRHIMADDDVYEALVEYVVFDKPDDFKYLCSEIIDLYPYRKDTIDSKQTYILNNWIPIQNLYNLKLSCPMESQISHNIAALFTSRPKAYSKSTITKLMQIRMLYKNGFNIRKLFLNNFNNEDIITINKPILSIDFSKSKDTFSFVNEHHKFNGFCLY